MEKIHQRENNFDLLRIIATTAVIIIHVGSYFKVTYNSGFGEFCDIFFKFGVPLFLMLSGAFIFKKKIVPVQFYKKALKKLGIPLAIVSVIYLIPQIIHQYNLMGLNFSILKEPIKALLKGEPSYHLWYMYMLIGLYAVIPLLQMVKTVLSNKNFDKLICFMLIWGALSIWTINFKVHWNGEFLAYIGYFLLGYKIKNEMENKKTLKYFVLGILFLILNYILYIFSKNYVDLSIANNLFNHRLTVLNIIASMYIFKGFCSLKIKRNMFYIAEKTYLIYLVHIIFLMVIVKFLNIYKYKSGEILDVFMVLIISVIIYILSHITSVFYEKCGQFLINRTYK